MWGVETISREILALQNWNLEGARNDSIFRAASEKGRCHSHRKRRRETGTELLNTTHAIRRNVNDPYLIENLTLYSVPVTKQKLSRYELANSTLGGRLGLVKSQDKHNGFHVTSAILSSEILSTANAEEATSSSVLGPPDDGADLHKLRACDRDAKSFQLNIANMSQDKPLPFIYQFAAGAVAGVSEVCGLGSQWPRS